MKKVPKVPKASSKEFAVRPSASQTELMDMIDHLSHLYLNYYA